MPSRVPVRLGGHDRGAAVHGQQLRVGWAAEPRPQVLEQPGHRVSGPRPRWLGHAEGAEPPRGVTHPGGALGQRFGRVHGQQGRDALRGVGDGDELDLLGMVDALECLLGVGQVAALEHQQHPPCLRRGEGIQERLPGEWPAVLGPCHDQGAQAREDAGEAWTGGQGHHPHELAQRARCRAAGAPFPGACVCDARAAEARGLEAVEPLEPDVADAPEGPPQCQHRIGRDRVDVHPGHVLVAGHRYRAGHRAQRMAQVIEVEGRAGDGQDEHHLKLTVDPFGRLVVLPPQAPHAGPGLAPAHAGEGTLEEPQQALAAGVDDAVARQHGQLARGPLDGTPGRDHRCRQDHQRIGVVPGGGTRRACRLAQDGQDGALDRVLEGSAGQGVGSLQGIGQVTPAGAGRANAHHFEATQHLGQDDAAIAACPKEAAASQRVHDVRERAAVLGKRLRGGHGGLHRGQHVAARVPVGHREDVEGVDLAPVCLEVGHGSLDSQQQERPVDREHGSCGFQQAGRPRRLWCARSLPVAQGGAIVRGRHG